MYLVSDSDLLTGWTLGAGAEAQLANNWFVRGEYRYTDLGKVDQTFFASTPDDKITAEIDAVNQRALVGLGIKF